VEEAINLFLLVLSNLFLYHKRALSGEKSTDLSFNNNISKTGDCQNNYNDLRSQIIVVIWRVLKTKKISATLILLKLNMYPSGLSSESLLKEEALL